MQPAYAGPVPETPDEESAPRPPLTSAWWYFVAAALVLLAPMIGAMIAASSWSEVRNATVQPIAGAITPADKGIAIFSDLDQDRTIVCTERPRGPKGGAHHAAATKIEPATIDLSIDQDGSQWHLVALETSPADRVDVGCAPKDGRVDNASYGYALVGGFGAAKIGLTTSVLGGVAGVALALGVAWRRARLFRPPPPQ